MKTAFEELDPDDFEVRYKFNRPEKNLNLKSPIVITCKSGVRAMKAAEALLALGYPTVGVYKGSFLDWESHGGKVRLTTFHHVSISSTFAPNFFTRLLLSQNSKPFVENGVWQMAHEFGNYSSQIWNNDVD